MKPTIKITVLMDNQVRKPGFLAEQGLSLLVRTPELKILFDVGQTNAFLHNSRRLGVDLAELDLMALSHGHYDHVGGLPDLLEETGELAIYAHPQILDRRYAQDANKAGLRDLGLTWEKEEIESKGAKFYFNTKPTYLTDNIFLTGEIPRASQQDLEGENFVKLQGSQVIRDPLLDDQALVVKSNLGWVIILGCSHAGVLNTLTYIVELLKGEKIHAVIGGMHLIQATKARISKTINGLQELGIEKVVPLHCTGFRACMEIALQMGKAFTLAEVGSVLEF